VLEQQQPDVPIEPCDWATEMELPAWPAVVWQWLNDPEKPQLWAGEGNRFEEIERPGGRSGAGAVVHCHHGAKNPYVFTVTDWRPFSFLAQDDLAA
jgi:uncharacterized protein YndB with AHSA1/START domain